MGLISYTREKKVSPKDADTFKSDFLDAFEDKLGNSDVYFNQRNNESISFRGAIFRFVYNGFNFFNGITRGEVRISRRFDSTYIYHKIYFTEAFVIALVFSALFIPMWGSWQYIAMLAFGIWLVFYLGNFIASMIRFDTYIDKLSDTILKKQRTKEDPRNQHKATN